MPEPDRGGGGIGRPSDDFGGSGNRGGSRGSGACSGASWRAEGRPDGGKTGRADSWPLEVTSRRGGGRSGGPAVAATVSDDAAICDP
ncbi:hypothetical protein [Candidatus Poriferisodalis sp.]|uniref:hypothetical protein n=1 Tax=Candidatus Poriferisodalis sp. TaxID=3101277 RepID=UPI003B02DC5D